MAKAATKSVKQQPEKPDADHAPANGRQLVVVESPAKAKTINRYLGGGFIVKASMGHVRDLPAKNMGVDLEHDFEPTYEPLPGRKKVLDELKKYAKEASLVFLATDLDREGEAIAWHLAQSMKLPAQKVRRVVFNEITAAAIQEAFSHPRSIDMNKVNAQQARRILDRIVGYQLSPLLWKKVASGLSAGRVQSVAVRLIVDRERQIEAFVPEEYWKIGAIFTTAIDSAAAAGKKWAEFLETADPRGNPPTAAQQQEFLTGLESFRAELVRWNGQKFNSTQAQDALDVVKALGCAFEVNRREDPQAKGPAKNRITVACRLGEAMPQFKITNLAQRESRSKPYAPFTTASLQQAASVQLRFSASRTMRLAQQLYEGVEVAGEGSVGLITYMRTDSTNLAAEAVAGVRKLIGEKFGPQYVPDKPNVFGSSQRAQEAHEAIRPTDARREPRKLMATLDADQYKLYELIWNRFVACQMPPCIWKVTEADITATTPQNEAVFKAMGRALMFDGFLKVAGLPRTAEAILPELKLQQPLAPIEVSPTQHFTLPPPRYTEASLVKALEAESIGRPSTYAAIIQTIQDRQYVRLFERAFRPTDLGIVVTDKLVKHFPEIFDVRFTAHMEDELDRIEDASCEWVAVLGEFYGPFKKLLEKAAQEMVHAKAEVQPSDYTCETCGKPMVYRFSKNGRYLACTGYPECKTTYPVDEQGKRVVNEQVNVACPKCGGPMVARKGRFGPFLSCVKYPDCNGVINLDRKGKIKPPSAPALEVDLPCPKCGGKLLLRRSKRGPWLSCSKYPKCRGRLAWSSVDPDKQKQLETALEEHEKAHPQPILRTLDGAEIPPGYDPLGRG
ncbi:MAG: type I DNA topoisomerase [Planctomycetes bacterium]|nr:type I DNA topoisomerase [Planctomycetota bacterium]